MKWLKRKASKTSTYHGIFKTKIGMIIIYPMYMSLNTINLSTSIRGIVTLMVLLDTLKSIKVSLKKNQFIEYSK